MSLRLYLQADVVASSSEKFETIHRYKLLTGCYPTLSQFIVDKFEADSGNSNSVITALDLKELGGLIYEYSKKCEDNDDFDEGEFEKLLDNIMDLKKLEKTVGTIYVDIKVTW